ncbi:hypothetical protein, partial [Aporhodopirellula aestuarii]
MRTMILSVCISFVAITATVSHADDPATKLNGTWQYVVAIEADGITTYDQSSAMQLVILDNTWALFKSGMLVQGTVENVEYEQQANPKSFVRRKGKAPHAVGSGILKITREHLMYTITPLDATGFGSTSGAVGNYESDPDGGGANATDPLGDTNVGVGRPSQHPPKSFSPEGTSNTQYILRRINDSTSLMNQITSKAL